MNVINSLCVILVITLVLGVVSVNAVELTAQKVPISEGKTVIGTKSVELTDGKVVYTDAATNISIESTILINGVEFKPEFSKIVNGDVVWGTGEKSMLLIDDPTVKMVYTYSGTTLKETITLKEDKQISFPITLAKGTKLIPWTGKEWKVVCDGCGNTMNGVVLEEPYGIDETGKKIEMEYTYDKGALSLEYNKTITTYIANPITNNITVIYSDITYPLIIDPTWTLVGNYWINLTGNQTIIKWNTTGTTTFTAPSNCTTISYLVVGGGGSGGAFQYGGGGGAGGFRNGTLAVTPNATYNVSVGAGGPNPGTGAGNSGNDSIFASITSYGGGGGGVWVAGAKNGGSGGGAGGYYTSYLTGGSPTNASFGEAGGNTTYGNVGQGGGGGAGGVGANNAVNTGGAGGSGVVNNLTGLLTWYAAGGGGSGNVDGGVGGSGIGGNGSHFGSGQTSGAYETGSGGGGEYTGNTAGAGGSGVVIISFLTKDFGTNIANFTITNYTTRSGLPVNLTNKSVINNTANLAFLWDFGDGTTNATIGNTSHYFATGNTSTNYTVDLTISSLYGSNKTSKVVTVLPWENVANFTTSTNSSYPGRTITFTDTSYKNVTTNLTYLWEFGDGYTSTTAGNVSHIYSWTGIFTANLSIYNNFGCTTLIRYEWMTISTDPDLNPAVNNTRQVSYSPKQVTFTVVDEYNNPKQNALVFGIIDEYTFPNGAADLVNFYGFSLEAAEQAVNQTFVLHGTTDSLGGISFTMLSGIRYRINTTVEGVTRSQYVYPSQDSYIIIIPSFVTPTPAVNYITYNLKNNTINTTTEYFNLSYRDTSGGTSSINFTVKNQSGVILYTTIVSGFGTTQQNLSSGPITHGLGDTYIYSFVAPQTQLGSVNVTQSVTWGVGNTLIGFPNWVAQWLAIGLIVLLTAAFSILSKKFALIIIPTITFFMMFYMGWIVPTVGTYAMMISLGILFTLGVLVYIQERGEGQ